ncbi:ABC transporter ATP-binding protein [Aminobacter ciceronei]|uniref:ABC-type oligopeptide transport system ATPase subunit n=1 Tax=Aminobacter ciceronei TaxID=150723 RepID=A0ABR6CFC1_9HYPH|nr:ATP-binding cassette domain-containing protein [Aminobacter ciceronei]MBA8909948.1 ABC-type oligopeptide transport system ATPase subunit [Aminobacter ciceronei]MBA9023720.1 ABC-type oligopeptide transport system ATPase subunit [Aminobacter ciceronei]
MAILEVEHLVTEFAGGKSLFKTTPGTRAVDDVSFSLAQGEVLGIVGESGSGKSTLAKTVLGIIRESAGQIRLDGTTVSGVDKRQARRIRADIQYVHQDPGAALDPWWSVGRSLHESLIIHQPALSSEDREAIIDRMLSAVGLDKAFKIRYPHELSGGQQRRIGLARSLILNPRILILDEPTSGLDLSVQATVVRLFEEIKQEYGLSYIFITHDLSLVRRISDRIAIMYRGKIVEAGETRQIFSNPQHEYTRSLLAAAPPLSPSLEYLGLRTERLPNKTTVMSAVS